MDLIKRLRLAGQPTINEEGHVDVDGIDYSAVDMWLRCGEQYRRRYVEGKRSPPGIALVEGTAHHASMEEDNKSKRDKGKQLTSKQLTDIFETKMDNGIDLAEKDHAANKSVLNWEGEDRGRLLTRAKLLHVDYAGKWSYKFEPELVEESFTKPVETDGVKFTLYGQTDLGTKTHILDYKTAAKAKSQRDVDDNLQLTLYSYVFNRPRVGIIAFVKTATPYVQYRESTLPKTPGQWIWGIKVVAAAVKAIRNGSFPLTNPGGFPPPWWCSERFCGYWNDCRGKFDPKPEKTEEADA